MLNLRVQVSQFGPSRHPASVGQLDRLLGAGEWSLTGLAFLEVVGVQCVNRSRGGVPYDTTDACRVSSPEFSAELRVWQLDSSSDRSIFEKVCEACRSNKVQK
eukprot:Hpha_TRINITY_DN2246_c0_g1::TRINITY_DN2246_c0_g1_i1::g.25360::m.25360